MSITPTPTDSRSANRIYAIGDIHGELAMLEQAVEKIERDGGADAPVVLLGDYVDRGPHSRGVIDYLINARAAGRNWRYLIGNHDRMFSMFLQPVPLRDPRLNIQFSWLHERLGGRQTLASYGIDTEASIDAMHRQARADVPDDHAQFLQSLEYSHHHNNLLFVHAGIRPGIPIESQSRDDLVWIRQEFLQDTRQHPALIVHGHTPVAAARHYGNRVALDTGAGYGKALSTAVFEGDDCWLLTDKGRELLAPTPLQQA